MALLVSLLIHTALLAPLLLVAPRLRIERTSNRANMVLGLVSEADLGIARRQASSTTSNGITARPATKGEAASHPSVKTLLAAPAPTKQPQAPGSVTTAPPSSDQRAFSAAANAGNQDAVRRALRTALACAPSSAQNLDDEGRAACRKRLNEAAAAIGDARVDTITPEKRAYYDAVAKAYQDPTGTTHLPGVGCALPFGIPKGWKPSGRKPPHSLKLGPLPCYIVPPKGFLTEEADIPPADEIPKN
jgi:hypothetical protein